MESCSTPTKLIEFSFNHIITPTTPSDCTEQMQNLRVTQNFLRAFSPITVDVGSPGVSPIGDLSGVKNGRAFITFNFTKPASSVNPTTVATVEQEKQQQEDDKLPLELQLSNDNLSFELDSLTSTKLESSSRDDSSMSSELLKNSSILNHTLSVTLLLKTVGLSEHSEKFASEGIDLNKFMEIQANDLKNLGLDSEEDCKAIIDMVTELKSF